MSNIARIYLDFLYNMFLLLLLLRIVKENTNNKVYMKISFLLIFVQFIYSIPTHISHTNLYSFLLDFLFVLILCHQNQKKIIPIYLKYEFASNIIFAITYFLHSLLLWDFRNIIYNKYYFQCKNLICISLIYIFYVLYSNTKRIKIFHTHYQYYFNFIIILTSVVLSYITLYVCKTDDSVSFIMPVLFSFIYILIIACISIYEKFIDLLSDNAKTKLQLQKFQLEQQYSAQIEVNLKSLSTIRHDIKNHLIVIQGYATQNNCSKILEYIQKIFDNFLPTHLIQTSSDTISAMLNAKYQEATRMNIKCDFICDFATIYIEDFFLITILGNLLDNAITASGKLTNGFVNLRITEIDSYLEIVVKNNHSEEIKESSGLFLSTKNDPNFFHGLGIKNVRSAVDKLNGHIDISHTQSEFNVSVLVPNY